MKKYLTTCWMMWLLAMPALFAQPDFNARQETCGITLFADAKQPATYYYLPGDLSLGTSDDRPDFSFVMMRYLGSYTTSDLDLRQSRNILTMRIVMKEVNTDSLQQARILLQRVRPGARLKPLPLSQVEAMVVFTPVGAPDTASVVARGELAAEGAAGYATPATFWRERYFTLFLDNHSAGLLLQAFGRDLLAMSFMYAFYSKGVTDKKILDVSGHGRLDSLLRQQFRGVAADSLTATSVRECIVKADAFPISIDTALYPGLLKKIDLNDAMPPGYAVLNVRNYDFAHNLRTDLYEKTVELEATGAGGNPVNLRVRFNIQDKDITSANFRFRYAVRLDRPYRYRVVELLNDGREIVSPWKTVHAWSNMLDVTTRPGNE